MIRLFLPTNVAVRGDCIRPMLVLAKITTPNLFVHYTCVQLWRIGCQMGPNETVMVEGEEARLIGSVGRVFGVYGELVTAVMQGAH